MTTTRAVTKMRIPTDRPPTSPGEMLLEEFLKPLGITQVQLAKRIRVPYVRVNELVHGKRRVTPSTALRLAKVFGTSPEFWLNGQLALDLYRTINDKKEIEELDQIEPITHVR
ncbi:MAG TPA: HigA family addiction module antitoxin [Rubrobacteraceae bacterium]|nr:HigA family addiction module antitoxin [Rubrobacteraceae bacterium]